MLTIDLQSDIEVKSYCNRHPETVKRIIKTIPLLEKCFDGLKVELVPVIERDNGVPTLVIYIKPDIANSIMLGENKKGDGLYIFLECESLWQTLINFDSYWFAANRMVGDYAVLQLAKVEVKYADD